MSGAQHPSIVETFRRSIATVAALPCDILIAVHPAFSDVDERLKQRALKPAQDPFIDPASCRTYAAGATERLDRRLAEEARTPNSP